VRLYCIYILFKDPEMIPARKMMDVHALCFVMNRVATTN